MVSEVESMTQKKTISGKIPTYAKAPARQARSFLPFRVIGVFRGLNPLIRLPSAPISVIRGQTFGCGQSRAGSSAVKLGHLAVRRLW